MKKMRLFLLSLVVVCGMSSVSYGMFGPGFLNQLYEYEAGSYDEEKERQDRMDCFLQEIDRLVSDESCGDIHIAIHHIIDSLIAIYGSFSEKALEKLGEFLASGLFSSDERMLYE